MPPFGIKISTIRQDDLLTPAAIGLPLDAEPNRPPSERAEVLGMSPHKVARRYGIGILFQAEGRTAFRQLASELKLQVATFMESHALVVAALLATGTKAAEEQAHVRVKEQL